MIRKLFYFTALCTGFGLVTAFLALAASSVAFASLPEASPNPQNGAAGVVGTIPSPPPSTAASIAVPTNGQTFSSQPITISGLCTGNLLIKVYSNGVFIGADQCSNGSYSVSASLFVGVNQLTAIDYDALNQAGPTSSTVTVTFVSTVNTSVPPIVLTSAYARRGANPGQALTWPIQISGGAPPYAISIDWGDGSSPELISQQLAGTINGTHTYKQSGVYRVLVKAVDQNGTIAFLQLVGVGDGPIASTGVTGGPINGRNAVNTAAAQMIWWPLIIALPALVVTFWLGRRYEVTSLRRSLEDKAEKLQNDL